MYAAPIVNFAGRGCRVYRKWAFARCETTTGTTPPHTQSVAPEVTQDCWVLL